MGIYVNRETEVYRDCGIPPIIIGNFYGDQSFHLPHNQRRSDRNRHPLQVALVIRINKRDVPALVRFECAIAINVWIQLHLIVLLVEIPLHIVDQLTRKPLMLSNKPYTVPITINSA